LFCGSNHFALSKCSDQKGVLFIGLSTHHQIISTTMFLRQGLKLAPKVGKPSLAKNVPLLGSRAYHAPVNEMNFAIHEVHNFADHYKKLTHITECDKDTIDMVVEASAQLCEQELAPLKVGADRIGCKWVDEVCVI
jgi:hypothetical protein